MTNKLFSLVMFACACITITALSQNNTQLVTVAEPSKITEDPTPVFHTQEEIQQELIKVRTMFLDNLYEEHGAEGMCEVLIWDWKKKACRNNLLAVEAAHLNDWEIRMDPRHFHIHKDHLGNPLYEMWLNGQVFETWIVCSAANDSCYLQNFELDYKFAIANKDD